MQHRLINVIEKNFLLYSMMNKMHRIYHDQIMRENIAFIDRDDEPLG